MTVLVVFRGIAQLVEQRSPKPCVEGSSPSAPASFLVRSRKLKFGDVCFDFQ